MSETVTAYGGTFVQMTAPPYVSPEDRLCQIIERAAEGLSPTRIKYANRQLVKAVARLKREQKMARRRQ